MEQFFKVKVDSNGNISWFKNNLYHGLNDEPARIYTNGTKLWYQYGKLHRANDRPAKEFDNGRKEWWISGTIHREGSYAVLCADGTKEWYRHGQLHREDGPAVEFEDGTRSWCLYGEAMTEREHASIISRNKELSVIAMCEKAYKDGLNSGCCAKELTVAEIEILLGYTIRVIKG